MHTMRSVLLPSDFLLCLLSMTTQTLKYQRAIKTNSNRFVFLTKLIKRSRDTGRCK